MEIAKQNTCTTNKWDMLMSGEHQQSTIFVDYSCEFKKPIIADMIVTEDLRLVMADSHNMIIKVMSLCSLYIVAEEQITFTPQRLALLSDNTVAMTTSGPSIGFLDISKGAKVKYVAKTIRRYYGIVEGPYKDTLIVSCARDEGGPASVDIISRDGPVVKIIANTASVGGMRSPGQMCVVGEYLFVPDKHRNCVFKLDISKCRLVGILSHQDMDSPTQVVCDDDGRLHVHSRKHNMCFVYTADGQCESYEVKGKHDKANFLMTLCATASGFVVSFVNDAMYPKICLLVAFEPSKCED